MSDSQFDDLKQFIDTRASQTEQLLRGDMNELRSELKADLNRLEKKVDDGFAGVAEAIEQINDRQADTDRRVTKLEQQAS